MSSYLLHVIKLFIKKATLRQEQGKNIDAAFGQIRSRAKNSTEDFREKL